MAFENGLLVSLPALELRDVSLEGSLFDADALVAAKLSASLRAAVAALEDARAPEKPLLFVARPEIFTDGAALDWLKARCGGALDHLHISDGSTVKLIAGFQNHVFFHGLGRREDREALGNLERRVPEIFAQLRSQVNTALSFRWKERRIQPQTLILPRQTRADPRAFELRRLFLNRNSAEDSAGRTLASSPLEIGGTQFADLHYVRLTERGLRDPNCTRTIASLAARLFLHPGQGAIFVTPELRDPAPFARLRVLAEGLLEGGGRLPSTTARNILTASDDLPGEALQSLAPVRHLIVDDADNFWRSPAAFYELFDDVTVMSQRRRHDPIALQRMLNQAYGARTLTAWSSDAARPHL